LLFKRWNGRLTAHAWRLLGDRERPGTRCRRLGWRSSAACPAGRPGAFPAWAYRIVSRRCAKGDRKGCARGRRPKRAGGLAARCGEPAGVRHAALRQAIDARSGRSARGDRLFYLEDMSVAEVAVALAVPAGTVKTRLMHARRKLRAALEGDE
jgi:DNA-directed RNA polymerase specialized sigma24 family protein